MANNYRVGDRFQRDGLTHRVTGVRPGWRETVLFARIERTAAESGLPSLVGPEQTFLISALTDAQWLAPVGVER